jgi:uncharacterized protein YndB with AHSA1/START domain
MPTANRSRTLAATQAEVWALIEDPHHFPRWWPGVTRIEAVEDESWTQVFSTKRGRPVRVDFQLIESHPPSMRSWEQEIEGTPFERVLNESITVVRLDPVPEGTVVRIELQQKLRGYSRTGGLMLRRATAKQLDEALEGLRRIFG